MELSQRPLLFFLGFCAPIVLPVLVLTADPEQKKPRLLRGKGLAVVSCEMNQTTGGASLPKL